VLFAWLSDFGLGAALLQKQSPLTESDLRSVFAVQQAVLGVLVIGVIIAAPALAPAYHLAAGGEWYFRAMAVGAFFASLKTVPNIVLERKLLYGRLTLVEVTEVVLFQLTAVVLAIAGQGAWAFIWAVVLSKAVGMVMTFVLSGWRPAFGLERSALRGLWWFAVPFQLTWVTYLFRDYLIPILGGLLLATVQVGYLNWAFALAGVPGQMAQVVGRVAFPSYSRLQTDRAKFASAVETSVRALFVVAIPAHLAMIALGRWLIEIVFTDKWLPALTSLYFLSLYWAGTSITTPLVSALNAAGRVRGTLILNIVWTVAQVGLSLVLLSMFGFPGIAAAFAIVRAGAIVAILVMVRGVIPLRLARSVAVPLAGSIVMAGLGYAATLVLKADVVNLIATGVAMTLLYAGFLWLIEGRRLRAELAGLLAQLTPAAKAQAIHQ
jgi:PST family polysaccharide transporter